ncbi:GNAT family N-acetyltransferase [Crossiella cryophila]|uniref:Putative GNAT superfamily acetyltransferase n=1 Tax=Crossiella cryophila TaxID=43355 RepID=A0A7W7FUV4_9PSEU|nr:GNAT family N-acetyltransferase [Crossiella cryophila]MBB4677843.1 putative GNAT superfamily acetyltransferase [Crossiella cryophila]
MITDDAVLETARRDAMAAAHAAGVEIAELAELADLQRTFQLFQDIWLPRPGGEPMTVELMRVLEHAGGYVAGAFSADQLVGASAGFLSAPIGRTLHSHIAGVSGQAQGRSVGYALKLHQRAWALVRGLDTITWTFDPLVRRNAFFNLAKLAALPAEYLPDFYGPMSDGINDSGPSDRIMVAWRLAEPAVAAACAGRGLTPEVTGARPILSDVDGRPVRRDTDAETVLVAVPSDVESLRGKDSVLAAEWRFAVRDSLGDLLERGAAVTGFLRSGSYVVSRKDLA